MKKICNKKAVRKDDLENVVIKAIMTLFENSSTIDMFAEKIIAVNKKRLKEQSVLTILQKELNTILKAKNNLILAIEQGIITSTTKERLQELEKQQENISAKILIEKSKNKTIIQKEDIVKFIKKALYNNAERVVDLLVRQIVLYDDKIIIKCNYADNGNNEYLGVSISSSTTILPLVSIDKSINDSENVKLEIQA